MLNPRSALIDCKYVIKNNDGSTRKMWSTFIVLSDNEVWKIRAIRNMLPAAQGVIDNMDFAIWVF
jgi:hypothetical protein